MSDVSVQGCSGWGPAHAAAHCTELPSACRSTVPGRLRAARYLFPPPSRGERLARLPGHRQDPERPPVILPV